MDLWILNAILIIAALIATHAIFFRKSIPRENRRRQQLKRLNVFLILFLTFTLAAFLILNGGGLTRNLRYTLFEYADQDLKQNRIIELAQAGEYTVPQMVQGMQLIVPKIGVTAPIIFPASSANDSVLASLEEGVGLYPGSVPVNHTGRAILLGHSSRASWYQGQYAYVFSLLPRLKVGDEFDVAEGAKRYTYRIFATNVLSRADANILLSSPTDKTELDLMTCYPIGSASERTIIRGELIATQ